MNEPIDLSPELERQQRIADILLMRSLDSKIGIVRYEVENVLLELNIRFLQYLGQFSWSVEFLALQCLHDFSRHLAILQRNSKSIDKSLPVAMLKDGGMIYLAPFVREDFIDGLAREMFITGKPKE
jgi:hypothetical protein